MKTVFGLIVLFLYVLVTSFLLLRIFQKHRRRRDELIETFEITMRQHKLKSFEILKESITIRNAHQTSELYRIVLNDSGSCFLYFHASGSPPIFVPLTRERAMLAMQGKGGIQA